MKKSLLSTILFIVAITLYVIATDVYSPDAEGKDWLELPETGAEQYTNQYIVSTTYDGEERNYTVFYDTDIMIPMWTAYPLNDGHMGRLPRPGSWEYNPDIAQDYQAAVRSHSYEDNTYSRGHMCPNSSRNARFNMQKQTFYVTNQVPQIQNGFNAGIWNSLEQAVQAEALKNEIYVVTGVCFNKTGENRRVKYVSPKDKASQRIPVPNYFYKAVLKVRRVGDVVTDASTVAFWLDHKSYSRGDFSDHTISVDQLEAWTGFNFFANLPELIETSAESRNTSWTEFRNF